MDENTKKELFSKWWELVEPQVYKFALLYSDAENDALDVLQDVALIAYLRFDDFTNEQHFRRWVLQRVKWFSLDNLRKTKRRRDIDINEMEVVNELHKGKSSEDFAAISELFRAIEQLPRNQKEVILGLLEGKTTREIARELDISEETVRSHKRFAKLKLIGVLEEDDE